MPDAGPHRHILKRRGTEWRNILKRVEEKVADGGLQALSPSDVEQLQEISRDLGLNPAPGSALIVTCDARTRMANRARMSLSLLRTERDFDALSAGLPERLRGDWRQLIAEELAYLALEEDLARSHRGQYVAIRGGEVVALGQSEDSVLAEAYEKCGNVPLYVHRVGVHPGEPVQIGPREP